MFLIFGRVFYLLLKPASNNSVLNKWKASTAVAYVA